MDVFRGATGAMALPLSEQVYHSHWQRYNSIDHIKEATYHFLWLVCSNLVSISYRYKVFNVEQWRALEIWVKGHWKWHLWIQHVRLPNFKCSSTSTVFEIFDGDNIVILISRLRLLTLPIYARPVHRWQRGARWTDTYYQQQ